jgi:hypothetical protein
LKVIFLGIFFPFFFETVAQPFSPEQGDSIIFEVQLPGKSAVGFNVYDDLLENFFLSFSNENSESSIIRRKIPRYFSNSLIFYAFFDREKGISEIT